MMTGTAYKNLRTWFRCLAAVMLTAACTGLEDIPSFIGHMHEYPVMAELSQGEATRIAVDGNSVTWEQNDQIQLTAVTDGIEVSDTVATSILKLYEVKSDPSQASFSGFVTLRSKPKDCYFTHPVGESMKIDAVAGTVSAIYVSQDGTHKPFLYGKSAYNANGMSLAMKHLGAVLEITLEKADITTISFVGNNLEKLSPIIIDPATGSITLPEEANVQISVPAQKEGKTYIFVPPVAMSKGFTLICSRADGSYFMKSYSDGAKGGYDFSAQRGVRIPIVVTDDSESFSVAASDLKIEHKRNDDGLLTGTSVSFKMNRKGAPDKLIGTWGATLVNEKGTVVRTFSSEGTVSGAVNTMNVSANTILLKAGTYTFAPYYEMYGVRTSLPSQQVPVSDPGVVFAISGSTSYDKYVAGNVSGANSHTNTTLAGLYVYTNVAGEIISDYSASMTGADNKTADIGEPSFKVESSNTIAYYGDKTLSKYQKYTMMASMKVGDQTFEVARYFHITGLPYEIDFRNGDDSSWSKSGTVKHSESRMNFYSEFNISSFSTVCDGVIISPSFYLPADIYVRPYADICCKSEDAVLHIDAGVSGSTSVSSNAKTITPHKISLTQSLKSKDYIECSSAFLLSGDTRCLIYAVTGIPTTYNAGLYRTMINYN